MNNSVCSESNATEKRPSANDMDCLWCCKPSCQEKCSQCGLVAFCSAQHLQNHLDDKGQCLPFRIRFSESKGRYAVAVQDIEPTQLILKDWPLVIGPSRQHQIVCVECLEPVDASCPVCPDCQFPLCQKHSSSGQQPKWHQDLECPFLQQQGFKAAKVGLTSSQTKDALPPQAPCLSTTLPPLLVQLASITPLRLILQGLRGHKSYQDLRKDMPPLYDFFTAHSGQETNDKKHKSASKALEADMVTVMWHSFGLKNCLSSEAVVRTAIGQLFNNAKSLERPGHNGSGLYGRYCMLNHCCVSNAKCIITPHNGSFPLEVRAQTRIEAGEEITTRYVGMNLGSPLRSQMLKDHWSFTCTCKRCSDPTELGTYASALRCIKCGPEDNGLMLPIGPVPAEGTRWCCNTCDAALTQPQVEYIVESGLRIIKNNTSDPPEAKLLEHVIKELSHIFHSNHYLVMQVKFVLLKLLVSQSSTACSAYDWARLTVVALSLLSVLNRLDPGASRNRGNVLKDLIKPYMKLAECEFKAGDIDDKALQDRKTNAQQFAKELIACYKFENMLSSN